MAQLNPPEIELGFSSPALGPWFDDPNLTMPTPEPNLSVRLPNGIFRWLPPAAGLLSLLVNEGQPEFLAGLRQADGTPAFSAGSLVALFRLLPEAEARLDALLSDFIASADGADAAAGVQRRARVRYLALEIQNGATMASLLWDVDPPAPFPDPIIQADHLGLKWDGTTLRNSDRPMRDLKRPGRFDLGGSIGQDILLKVGGQADGIVLWAFDDRGLAIDPGAVAGWWDALARDRFENQFLWAPGLVGLDRRTVAPAQLQPVRTVHLVNPHEGRAQELETEVTVTNLQGSGPVRRQDPFGQPSQLALDSPPPGPPRRLALLPNGTYAGQVTVWPTGPTFPVRDFVRVALVDLDRHLVGPRPEPDDPEVLAQARPQVRPNADPVLLDDIDAAAAAVRDTLTGGGERRFATSILSADWGAFPVAALPAVADLPGSLDDPEVVALRGGGEAQGDTVAEQRVLVDFTLSPTLAGAWLRAWPQGFDVDTARHVRLDGGGAPIRADGGVTLVVKLPPGNVGNSTRMGMDVLLVTASASRTYTDLRFDRPAPVAGAALAVGAASGPFTVCETGLVVADAAGLGSPGRVPPGATVVSRQSPAALIDPESLAAGQLTTDAALGSLTAGLAVTLTVPAFHRSPRGSAVARLAAGGAAVEEVPRNGLQSVTAPGAPLPGQERLEVTAGRVDVTDVRAALATAPAASCFHERLPHQAGHPGVPASEELHGTGVLLSGPAALPVIEHLRDRTARKTLPDLFNAARALLPSLPDPPGPVHWTAVLRTVSPGVEGEPGLGLLAETSLFPFGQTLDKILAFLSGGGPLPPNVTSAIPQAQAVARALDRRIFAASRGARDTLRSLREAFSRAEHFVYVESPAIDALPVGGEAVSAWQALQSRLDERKGLRVLVCFPVHLLPGSPLRLEHVRNALLAELTAAGGDRVEMFPVNTGPARSLRLTSTTVVVDDAYALTGTSHLWRRGMTFDSSIAVSVFDEQLERGRPQQVRAFRRRLLAGRLGITVEQLPEDPSELLLAIRQLRKRGGGHRLATEKQETPELKPTEDDHNAWNRDGSPEGGLSSWLNEYLTLVQSAALQDALGSELSTP